MSTEDAYNESIRPSPFSMFVGNDYVQQTGAEYLGHYNLCFHAS